MTDHAFPGWQKSIKWMRKKKKKKYIFGGKEEEKNTFFPSLHTIISRPNGSNGAAICCLVPFCHCSIYIYKGRSSRQGMENYCLAIFDYQRYFKWQWKISRFDNFQFVDFHAAQRDSKNPEAAVSLAALMEVNKN